MMRVILKGIFFFIPYNLNVFLGCTMMWETCPLFFFSPLGYTCPFGFYMQNSFQLLTIFLGFHHLLQGQSNTLTLKCL